MVRDDRGRVVTEVIWSCVFAGDVERLDLVLPGGYHAKIFEFYPWSGVVDPRVRPPYGPVARWVTPGVLSISIGVVDGVVEKRTDVEGVHVIYDIGTDLSDLWEKKP